MITVQKQEVIKQTPQRYQEIKQSKFINVGGSDQANITMSTALGGAGPQNAGSGINFQPSLTNEYMLSKESLLEASRPSLHNNSHYVEAGRIDQQSHNINQLSIQGQKSQSNNQSFHSTMQQNNKNNKFIDQKYHKGSGSGGLVIGRRQQNQNVSTSNMMIAKSTIGIGNEGFEMGNQAPGSKSKPQTNIEVKSQPTANTTATQQSHMTSLFSKGKFFQSHQYSQGSHYGQSMNIHASPGSV